MNLILKHIKKWAIDYNWCHAENSDGQQKVIKSRFDVLVNLWIGFYRLLFWPIPDMNCWCCGSVRGLLYGWILGCLFFYWWWVPFVVIIAYAVLAAPFILWRIIKERKNGPSA